jgi:putative nucleotidyltransferase with HDIG domain
MQRVSKREIEQALRALVPLSNSAQALIAIASDPKHEAADLIRVIERDAHLTIRVLEIANSSAFAPASPIESVDRAVRMLGERAVVAAALEIGAEWLHAPIRGYGAQARLFEDGLKTAVAAAQVARRVGEADLAPVAYTAGLLHDVGKAVLSAFLEPRMQTMLEALAADPTGDWLAVERSVVGTTHCEVGAQVALQFKLPAALGAAIAHHHDPSQADPKHRRLVEIVHVADVLQAMMGGSEAVDALAYRLDPAVLSALELDDETFGEVLIESVVEAGVLLEAVGLRSPDVDADDEGTGVG